MTRFVDVGSMVKWVAQTGAETIIRDMVEYIESDFARWEEFDRTPRVASHTPFGVIELMPTSDRETYSFKYVNGHPSNPGRGYQTVTAFGVLANVHNGYPTFLAEMTAADRATHRGDLRNGRPSPGPTGLAGHGDDWRRKSSGVSGSRIPWGARNFAASRLGHRPGRDGQGRA